MAGTAYLAALIAVCWPFSIFMISQHAQNWFFGMASIPYFVPPSAYHFFYHFPESEAASAFAAGLAIAWGSAMVSSRIGIALGDVMRKLQR